jgi:hypothetical protein
MVKTSDWIRMVVLAISAFVILVRMRQEPPARAPIQARPSISAEVEDLVPEPPKNDGYVDENDLPPIDEDTISFGASREFGEQYPFIIVDGKRLDFDRHSGHYHYAGTKDRAIFARSVAGYILVTADAWEDAKAAFERMSTLNVK